MVNPNSSRLKDTEVGTRKRDHTSHARGLYSKVIQNSCLEKLCGKHGCCIKRRSKRLGVLFENWPLTFQDLSEGVWLGCSPGFPNETTHDLKKL